MWCNKKKQNKNKNSCNWGKKKKKRGTKKKKESKLESEPKEHAPLAWPGSTDSPMVPAGHGCFAVCPWRVLNHMISRASTASQLSSRAGTWDDADGRCVVISSSTSTAGDGLLVLRFLLPDAEGVVLLPAPQVVVRRVVLVVVLPAPRGPVVEISEIKFKRKHLHGLFTVASKGILILQKPFLCWQFKEL